MGNPFSSNTAKRKSKIRIHCRRITRLHQLEVHKQPPGPAISIDERVDLDKSRVQFGRALNHVHLTSLFVPLDQQLHFLRQVEKIGGVVLAPAAITTFSCR
jgi:hypothetical protein